MNAVWHAVGWASRILGCVRDISRQRMAGVTALGSRIRRRVREPGWTGAEAGRGSGLREELERHGGAARGEGREGVEEDRVREMPGAETAGTALPCQLQKGHHALPSMRCCMGNFMSPPKAHNFSHSMRTSDKPKLRDRLQGS